MARKLARKLTGKRAPRGAPAVAPVRASPWQVYLLRCRDGSLYAGITVDLERRLGAHQTGRGAAYTRSRRPVELVYAEPALDRSAALRREAALKRLPRSAKLDLVMSTAGRD